MSKKKYRLIMILLIPALAFLTIGGMRVATKAMNAAERSAHQNALKQIGLAFKLYAENDPEGRWPNRAKDAWLPDMDQFGPYLEKAGCTQETLDYLQGERGIQLCYLGYAVKDSHYAYAVLEAYQKHGVKAIAGESIIAEPIQRFTKTFQKENPYITWGPQQYQHKEIHVLKKDVARYFIHDIMGPAGSSRPQSDIPVLWEIPDTKVQGGNVLFMGGHIEFNQYHRRLSHHREFPINASFIDCLREKDTNKYYLHMDLLDGDIPTDTWTANIVIDGCEGYCIVAGIPLVLFPEDIKLPEEIKTNLWSEITGISLPSNPQEFIVDMGTGHGFRWFGLATVPVQEVFRRHFNLEGGDDRLQILTEHEAFYLMPPHGDAALPYLNKVMKTHPDDEIVYKAICALDSINTNSAKENMSLLLHSDNSGTHHVFMLIVDTPKTTHRFSTETCNLIHKLLRTSEDTDWALKVMISLELEKVRHRYHKGIVYELPFDGLPYIRQYSRDKIQGISEQVMAEKEYRDERFSEFFKKL